MKKRGKGIQTKIEGLGELEKAMEKATKQFPYSTEKILKKEAREIKKQVTNAYVGNLVKSKRKKWKKSLEKKSTKSLEKSFSPGKVIKHGNKYTTAVTSKAPHYHLVEDGHEESGWYAEQSDAKPVSGKKIVAKIMARRSENAEKMGEELLNEILKEAGLL